MRAAALLASALAAGCAASEPVSEPAPEARPTPNVAPFLMFQDGRAEEAMRAYVAAFEDGEVVSLERHPAGGAGPEGQVMLGEVVLAGERVLFSDSAPVHDFDFTPSTSLFVEVGAAAELDRLAQALVEGGEFLMPPGDYGFSRRFAWVQDRFGVSWQLNVAAAE